MSPLRLISSTRGRSSNSQLLNSKRRRAEYTDLEVNKNASAERDLELGPVKPLQTFIEAVGTRQIKGDGIYLQFEVEQETNEG